MESLAILVPLSVALVLLIGWVFWRALEGGQFDDLDRWGHSVLVDDDQPRKVDLHQKSDSTGR